MKAIRVGDSMRGNVGSHNQHIIGWTQGKVPSPIYCSGHAVSGLQTTGAQKTYIEGKRAARQGDTGTSDCPCDGRGYTISEGSKKVFIEGKPAARNIDATNIHGAGTGTFRTSSQKVFIG